ncbi:transcription elongation regulator 1-like protein [Plectropomus leopardus]|uniref:transcription elongation regulator 1-like protein n=1 Tax=Plectropomus leopardus TaxID=160734 RepID=UPI001C4C783E|nr:transcription elongation regulator 1-like protein [Plectropomus leopardus]
MTFKQRGASWEWAGLHIQGDDEAWPVVLTNQLHRGAWSRPILSLERRLSLPTQHCVFGPVSPSELLIERWPVLPAQVIKEVSPSFFSSRFSSRFTLLTNCRHKKRGMSGGEVSYGRALLLRTNTTTDNKQCVCVSADRAMEDEEEKEGSEERRKEKLPVASTPVPGSPWCVVWTGDDRVFFFNPTIHLSVWERPGELIGRDISCIIDDPPHKRKKTTTTANGGCQSTGLHGNDEDDEHEHTSKRNRSEETMSLIPRPGEVKLLPLELRITHFRDMLLERGVSAFSTWEKELHKMVFDPRYLLLTSDQRKQVFDQFVKSRLKDEYKEKKTKLQKAREEFKQLLEEAKITSRSTFKEFCGRYRGDQRFDALNRKKEQEVLFHHYITSLKRRDKENRARLRKMR